ncbi:MAG TPA: hypothetical protein VK436_14620 [Methanocella sp.]|nr:hypothetical protein [Methanocella sp.]
MVVKPYHYGMFTLIDKEPSSPGYGLCCLQISSGGIGLVYEHKAMHGGVIPVQVAIKSEGKNDKELEG